MLDRQAVGELPPKPHLALRGKDGTLRYEECITREGFEGPYVIVYHRERPHLGAPFATTQGSAPPVAAASDGLLRRHYRALEPAKDRSSPLSARIPLLFNQDVVLSVLRPGASDTTYFSNGDGDDLYFIHSGGGVLRSLLGDVRFEAGDYLFVPKGMIHRFELDAQEQYWLGIECLGGFSIPKSFRNATGQLRMDAPYSHRDFRRPEFKGPLDEGIAEVVVKRNAAFFGFRYPASPLDAVGWDGTVYPWAFPILAFQPRVGQTHLPPTAHGTFETRGALICSFVPRPLDFHKNAVPCPYPHSSVDIDEVLFYSRGEFTSRKGVGPCSISHHPSGIPHGPHPGAYEGSIGKKETSELAVMLDCKLPLLRTSAALAVEDAGYHQSFVG